MIDICIYGSYICCLINSDMSQPNPGPDAGCNGGLAFFTEPEGEVTSPGYCGDGYPNNADCRYVIVPESNKVGRV